MGMGMMGRNPAMGSSSMSGMNMPSALPGFPGAGKGRAVCVPGLLGVSPVPLGSEVADPGDATEGAQAIEQRREKRPGVLLSRFRVDQQSVDAKTDEDRCAEVESEDRQFLGNPHESPLRRYLVLLFLITALVHCCRNGLSVGNGSAPRGVIRYRARGRGILPWNFSKYSR